MSTQLLFYANAVPINSERHRDLSVKVGDSFAFAANVNSVPVMTVEFARAAREYPVVFAGDEKALLPVAVLGLERERNLFVAADGRWDCDYVPAFVRRYPFVFASDNEGRNFTLCLDEGFSGCNREGRGERLFDADGERTSYLSNVLNFTTEYQAQFQRTRAFCDRLHELGLLEPMQAQFTLPGGGRPSLSGFYGVNRARLQALDDATMLSLARDGGLELIHLHLHSLTSFNAVVKRAGAVPLSANTATSPVTGAAGGTAGGAPTGDAYPESPTDDEPPLVTH